VGKAWSNSPVADELPRLLAERGLSVRELGRRMGIDHGHISRIVHQQRGKVASGDLAGRIAVELGLPADYFPEYRRAAVVAAIAQDPALLDRLYHEISRP
jgi:transcriptional regulator with XRE-family HTH domain